MAFLRILILLLYAFEMKGQMVYKTPHGRKYHLESCRMVENVSEALDVTKAHKLGLTACKICKPPHLKHQELINPTTKDKGESNTVQCRGITKSGKRCKHRTSIANGYCFQHNPDK